MSRRAWERHLVESEGFEPASLLKAGSLPRLWASIWEKSPAHPVLYSEELPGWLTAGELEERSRDLAGRLAATGAGPGDRVLICLRSPLRFCLWHIAVLRLGAVCVPANPSYPPAEMGRLMRASRPAVTVVDAEVERTLKAAGSGDSKILLDGGRLLAPEEVQLDRAEASWPALLPFTSGTTGTPKGVSLSHGNLLAGAQALVSAWRWDPDDLLVLALPLFHMHGLGVGLHGTLAAGAAAVLAGPFSSQVALEEVRKRKASLFFGVPTMYGRLLSDPSVGELRRLRLAVSGSAPLPSTTWAAFRDLTGIRILERYGMTETLMILSNPYEGERRAGSVGFELPGVEVRLGLCDSVSPSLPVSGSPAEASADPWLVRGEIQVRGPNVFRGYAGPASGTDSPPPVVVQPAFGGPDADGWFATGDIAEEGGDGYFRIVGRARELIITGGYNVFPREVEMALLELPGVAEAAVVGIPSGDRGEEVAAFVVPAPGEAPDPRLLAMALEGVLAPYKRPRKIEMVEELPRNALGKVVPAELLARLR